MPPRAVRTPKTDSLSVAVKSHLYNAAASAVAAASNGRSAGETGMALSALETDVAASIPSSSRVSRRRRDVVPQETPEWQRMALETAAASRKSRACTAKKAKPNGRRRGAAKGRAESDEDEDEAAAAAELSSQRGEDVDHSASPAGIDASSSIRSKHAKPRRRKAEKAAGTPATKRGQRIPVAELVCPRCKLRMDHWPFCGLSGDAHVLLAALSASREEDEARPNEAAAAAAAAH